MTVADPIETLRQSHSQCGCETGSQYGNMGGFVLLDKDNCTIVVEGLEISLDCDKCTAFTENDLRPDIIAVQRCEGTFSWVVFEMKNTLRKHAADQAAALFKG